MKSPTARTFLPPQPSTFPWPLNTSIAVRPRYGASLQRPGRPDSPWRASSNRQASVSCGSPTPVMAIHAQVSKGRFT
ncbi:hypothetical protein OF83DRAFT_1116646 [Amylostereum chailletii]|nr:hypothetical protein OF83DRAFT_1116646 [Amylostereum chailletii]